MKAKVKKGTSDPINPSHYKQGGLEAIQVFEAFVPSEEFLGYLRISALKYLLRYGLKDDRLQEAKKAQWFINKLIEVLEGVKQ